MRLSVAVLFTLASCSRSALSTAVTAAPADAATAAPQVSVLETPPAPPPPATHARPGVPYDLRVDETSITYCIEGKAWRLATPSSPPAPFSRKCGVDTPDGEGCAIPGRHLDVSRPGLGPDDIVSLDGVAETIVVPGSTTSCAADGDAVVIASDQDVWLVKPNGSKRALSHAGGDHVAIGPTTIAWVEGKKVRAVARH